MPTALEQSFADICEGNGLTCLSVDFYPSHEGAEFSVYVHAELGCATGSSGMIAAALAMALAELAAMRATPDPLFADEALPAPAALQKAIPDAHPPASDALTRQGPRQDARHEPGEGAGL